MSYNPDKPYYRCTIIRGKAQQEMDDMLPLYATAIRQLCPMGKEEFKDAFRDIIAHRLYRISYERLDDSQQKVVDNHRTEIAGKHLCLYLVNEQDIVVPTDSCQMVLAKSDQPAFFKNLCLNFQFPNYTQKIQTVKERITDGIHFKPFHFILAVLKEAEHHNVILSVQHFAYYVLSSIDVLQGGVTPHEVMSKILSDNQRGLRKSVPAGSRYMQHIREQLNLLELANLISVRGGFVYLNHGENRIINKFIDELHKPLGYDITQFDLDVPESAKKAELAWQRYYGSVLCDFTVLNTTITALATGGTTAVSNSDLDDSPVTRLHADMTNQELGEDGESLAFQFEKNRVASVYPRLLHKVFRMGDRKGLGYDIKSIEGPDNRRDPEKQRFIEVKSTKRATEPIFNEAFDDRGVNVTYTEWSAAKQFRDAYMFYIVYITRQGKYMFKIKDPIGCEEEGNLRFHAPIFEMTYNKDAIQKIYEEKVDVQ